MKSFSAALFVAALAASIATAAEKSKSGPEVLVVADAIRGPDGDFHPAPGQPVYYIMAKKQLSIGEAVAGVKMPDPAAVERAVVAALASQGFVRTQVGGPMPSVFLLVTWGDANFADLEQPTADPADADAVAMQEAIRTTRALTQERPMVENLVGTRKMEALGPSDSYKLAAASNEDRLYVSIAALDAQAFAQKNKRLLWRTSMTIDWRNRLADALPIMLASAAPFFGRSSAVPVFLDDAARRKGNVEIGELKVVNDEAKPSPSPTKSK